MWRLAPFARKDQAAWEAFFGALEGAPRVIVTDADTALALAVKTVFADVTTENSTSVPNQHGAQHLADALALAVDPQHALRAERATSSMSSATISLIRAPAYNGTSASALVARRGARLNCSQVADLGSFVERTRRRGGDHPHAGGAGGPEAAADVEIFRED